MPTMEWCTLVILKPGVSIEDEASYYQGDLQSRNGTTILEKECSFTHILEVFLLMVTVLAKDTHYRCNFTDPHHMLNLHSICPMVKTQYPV